MRNATHRYGRFTPRELAEACARVAASAIPHLEDSMGPGSFAVAEAGSESPIELSLALALQMMGLILWGRPLFTIQTASDIPLSTVADDGEPFYWLVPQYPMSLSDRNVRVDLMVVDAVTSEPVAAIECDGHEYHERTKEQAQRDRSRDRMIQRDGLPVLRFTGSEIYRDPCGCAQEIINFVDQP